MKVSSLKRSITYSQICFWLTMALCVALAPDSLSANSGISYFGHHILTIIPFEVGVFATAYFLLGATKAIGANQQLRFLVWCLWLMIVGVIGIAIMPAIGDGLLDHLHRLFGILTFVTQLVLSAWLIVNFRNNVTSWLIYCLQILGGIIALIYLQPVKGFSIEGQLLFQLAFSVIMGRALLRMADNITA